MSGTAKLIIYLLDVDDNEALEQIADKITRILAVPEKDDNCRGIIAGEAWDAPDGEEDLVREIGKDASWLIISSVEKNLDVS